ncbi:hypothetical protein [Mycobacterium sp. 3519A]|uniref:hypothetical protein n=1 Tax=Mycobacterium sp. 3519A TaxID=2057184 RepID=UPI001F346124|nr:hypothetical protein [Mycobacterium sp. 3519A]
MIASASAGFLLAVLWMDLIFDSQVLRHRGADVLPETVIASVSSYYRRATTRPMSLLIAVVMLILLGALGFHWMTGGEPVWLMVALTVLAGVPIMLALTRTVPNAVRLGAGAASQRELTRLARAICLDHVVCLVLMSAFLAFWVSV